MKVIVTGSAGFIGFYLAKQLLKKKYQVYGIDNYNNYYSSKLKKERIKILSKNSNFKFRFLDLKRYNKSLKLFKEIQPYAIYHLASQPGIMYSFKNPKTYRENNIIVTKNLIQACKNLSVKKFYFTSSSSVYGNQKKYPIKENFSLKPINFYARSKKKCEELLKKSFKETDIDLKIFRPFTVYGPSSRPDMLFITYLNKSKNREIFNIYNNGEYIRDFTYVEDVAEILCSFLKISKKKNNTFNICSSKPLKLINIIQLIDKYNKIKTKLKFKPLRKGEIIKTFGDNAHMKKIIKYKKFTNLNEGIKKTVKWYKNYKFKKNLFFNKV